MPVTAKLSRKLSETLGDDDTNELVDLLNSVHTYRGELRALNESNVSRFEGTLAEMNGRWEGRFAAFDAKLEQRVAEMRAELRTGLAMLKGELLAQIGDLRGDTTAAIGRAQSATIKWMFTFWAPTAIAIIGTAIGVVALLLRR